MQKYIYVLSNTCQAVKNFQIRLFGIARKSMHFFFNCTPVKTISMFSFSYKNKELAKLSFFSPSDK